MKINTIFQKKTELALLDQGRLYTSTRTKIAEFILQEKPIQATKKEVIEYVFMCMYWIDKEFLQDKQEIQNYYLLLRELYYNYSNVDFDVMTFKYLEFELHRRSHYDLSRLYFEQMQNINVDNIYYILYDLTPDVIDHYTHECKIEQIIAKTDMDIDFIGDKEMKLTTCISDIYYLELDEKKQQDLHYIVNNHIIEFIAENVDIEVDNKELVEYIFEYFTDTDKIDLSHALDTDMKNYLYLLRELFYIQHEIKETILIVLNPPYRERYTTKINKELDLDIEKIDLTHGKALEIILALDTDTVAKAIYSYRIDKVSELTKTFIQ